MKQGIRLWSVFLAAFMVSASARADVVGTTRFVFSDNIMSCEQCDFQTKAGTSGYFVTGTSFNVPGNTASIDLGTLTLDSSFVSNLSKDLWIDISFSQPGGVSDVMLRTDPQIGFTPGVPFNFRTVTLDFGAPIILKSATGSVELDIAPITVSRPIDPIDGQDRFSAVSVELLATLSPVAPAVPEPSTWAMMLLGFCGLGFLAYRRKNQTARNTA